MAAAKKLKSKKVTTVSHDEHLDEQLKDIVFATGFLNACLGNKEPEDVEVFFGALKRVIRIHGIGKTAERANIKRVTLDKLLEHKNPTLDSFSKIVDALGMELQLKAKRAI